MYDCQKIKIVHHKSIHPVAKSFHHVSVFKVTELTKTYINRYWKKAIKLKIKVRELS